MSKQNAELETQWQQISSAYAEQQEEIAAIRETIANFESQSTLNQSRNDDLSTRIVQQREQLQKLDNRFQVLWADRFSRRDAANGCRIVGVLIKLALPGGKK